MAKIILTAQNIDIYEGDGLDPFARTGATSAEQIYHAGAEGIILGHSEVGDSPEVVRQKLLTVIHKAEAYGNGFLNKLTVLVGETWEEFKNHSTDLIAEKVSEHLQIILKDISKDHLLSLVVGYEPKWGSRGSGQDDAPPPSAEVISAVCKNLRSKLVSILGSDTIPIIYGGRSTPERTEQILADENVEGLILGSACNSLEKTMDIAKVMAKMRPTKRKVLHANFKAYELADTYEVYIKSLRILDDSFTVYLSPCYADLRIVRSLLNDQKLLVS